MKKMLFSTPQKKTGFGALFKTALCALLLLATQCLATIILCARSIWPDFEYEQIIANANLNTTDFDLLNFSPEIKYYLIGGITLYLLLISLCSNRFMLKLSGIFILIFIWQLRIVPYYYYRNTYTDLYEKYYQAPQITAADFPEHKRNLLVVYMESTENNFSDAELYENNLLPRLTDLTKSNPHFSNYNMLYGTNYTKAALVTGLCGIPYSTPSPKMESIYNHLRNITCLSDILSNNGYETWFAQTADHFFAYTDVFYKSHKYKNVIDRQVLTQGMSKEDIKKYKSSYGGLSDKLMFDYILNLFKNQTVKEPFLFTTFTIDTHVPGTVLPYNCPKKYGDIRDNIACADTVVSNFISEFQKTPYWENTTVIILGDHPMFKPLKVYSNKDYKRGIYNVFLNTPKELQYNSTKPYTPLDLTASFIEALGIKLANHSFGLGRSLFSDIPSLITHKDYNLKTAVRQKSKIYEDFSLSVPPRFVPYTLGEEINNNNIKTYVEYAETVLEKVFVNGIGLKLEKLPHKNLEMELTFNAMLTSKPRLIIKLNQKELEEFKLEKRPGPQTVKVILPKEKITSPELNLEFINNNFRSAVSQSINIQKLIIREIQ